MTMLLPPFRQNHYTPILQCLVGMLQHLGYEVTGTQGPSGVGRNRVHIKMWTAPICNTMLKLAETRHMGTDVADNEDTQALGLNFTISGTPVMLTLSTTHRDYMMFTMDRPRGAPSPETLVCLAKRTEAGKRLAAWWADPDAQQKPLAFSVNEATELFLAVVREESGVDRNRALAQNNELEQALLGIIASHGKDVIPRNVPDHETSLMTRQVETRGGLVRIGVWYGPSAWQEGAPPRVCVSFHLDGYSRSLVSSRPNADTLVFQWADASWLDQSTLQTTSRRDTLGGISNEWNMLLRNKPLTLLELGEAIGIYLTSCY